ncbi:hypothetical protein HN446_04445, partial [bacterium]|nr:hypothetical protein [bacterium]
SLGNVPDDWKYSFQVWNDTNKPVFGISQNIHSFMGARIIGGLQKMVPVLPYCSTEDAFYDLHMYMNIYICKDSFALKLATDLMGIVFDGTEAKAKNALGMSSVLQAAVSVGFSPINLFEGIADYELFSHYAIEVDGLSDSRVIMANMSNKLFEQAIDKDHQAGFYEHFRLAGEVPDFYRAYERNGETKVEFLSKRFTSTTFSGMIYNNAEAPVKVSFVKGGKAYTDIKLDPGSFNYINSSCGDGFDKSMRPSLFIFDLEGNNILDTDINDLKNKSKKENDAVKYAVNLNKKNGTKYAIPLRNVGLGGIPSPDSRQTTSSPETYVIEVYTKGADTYKQTTDYKNVGSAESSFESAMQSTAAPPVTVAAPTITSTTTTSGATNKGVGIQGVNTGNFDQPVGNMRDINPLSVHIWNKSADQAVAIDYTGDPYGAVDMTKIKGDFIKTGTIYYDYDCPVWVGYGQEDNPVFVELPNGEVTTVELIRPRRLDQDPVYPTAQALASLKTVYTNLNTIGYRFFYIVAFNPEATRDQIMRFFSRLTSGSDASTIGHDAIDPPAIDKQDLDDLLSESNFLPNTKGTIDDTAGSGVKATILASDIITSFGNESGGYLHSSFDYYYTIEPSVVQISYFTDPKYGIVAPFLKDPAKSNTMSLIETVSGWLHHYSSEKEQCLKDVCAYIKVNGITDTSNGKTSLFKNVSDASSVGGSCQDILSVTGQIFYENLIAGLEHSPKFVSAAEKMNIYSLSKPPKSWKGIMMDGKKVS